MIETAVEDRLKFKFISKREALIFYKAFLPEVKQLPMKRSAFEIRISPTDEAIVEIDINSEDLTAYRATINSFVQFADVVEGAINFCRT